jgi:hypothetical protein
MAKKKWIAGKTPDGKPVTPETTEKSVKKKKKSDQKLQKSSAEIMNKFYGK